MVGDPREKLSDNKRLNAQAKKFTDNLVIEVNKLLKKAIASGDFKSKNELSKLLINIKSVTQRLKYDDYETYQEFSGEINTLIKVGTRIKKSMGEVVS